MKKKSLIVTLLFSMISINAQKQDDFAVLKGPYLGQKPPGENPELFMFGLISTLDVEYCIAFLDKGKVCVYGRDDIGVNYTYLKDGHWTEPQKMRLNSGLGEWKYNVAPNDKTLYFMSPRPTRSSDTKNDMNIYKTEWTGSGWTEQKILPFPPNSMEFHEIYPSISTDGSAYFHGGEFRNAPDINDDIYRSQCVKGIYKQQERLNEPISTGYGEYDAFVAPNEEFLMFGSDRPGGYGRYDTYICFKKDDRSWTHPVNAGSKLNSISWENRVIVTPDGKYMFFVSGRPHPLLNDELENGKYTSVTGFYWVDTSFIKKLKKRMVGSRCAAKIISEEYKVGGIKAAIRKLTELIDEMKDSYHFLPSELLVLCRDMIVAGKIKDADIFCHALLDNLNEDFRFKRGYGMICLINGHTRQGLNLLKEALSDHPVELMVLLYKQGSYLFHKSRKEALKVMQFNAQKFPKHYLPKFGLSRIHEKLGNTKEAIECCEKTLQLNPDYSPAINLLKQLKDNNERR